MHLVARIIVDPLACHARVSRQNLKLLFIKSERTRWQPTRRTRSEYMQAYTHTHTLAPATDVTLEVFRTTLTRRKNTVRYAAPFYIQAIRHAVMCLRVSRVAPERRAGSKKARLEIFAGKLVDHRKAGKWRREDTWTFSPTALPTCANA